MQDGQEDRTPSIPCEEHVQVTETTDTGDLSKVRGPGAAVRPPPWQLVGAICFVFLFLVDKYFGGSIATFGFFLVFTWAINSQLFPFKRKFREIAINAIFNPDSRTYKFLIAHPTLIVWMSWSISSVISVSMMLFMQSWGGFDMLAFLIGMLAIHWLYKRSLRMQKTPLQDDIAVLVREYVVNAVSVLFMLVLFGATSFIAGDAHRFPIVLDPDIPIYVKETVRHSSFPFQVLLRFYRCMELTILNLAALNGNVLVAYKLVHAITAQTLPILGIVLFCKSFLRMNEGRVNT